MQVWHQDPEKNRFDKVAEVDRGDVQAAAILTAFPVERWPEFEQIKPEPGEHRSTQFGDIIIDNEGVEYRFQVVEGGYPGFRETTAIFDQGYTEFLAERAIEEAMAIGMDMTGVVAPPEAERTPRGWDSVDGGAYSADEWAAHVTEIREEEHAARAIFSGEAYAATYDARMAEAYSQSDLKDVSREPTPKQMSAAEMNRLLDEMEAAWAKPATGVADRSPDFEMPDLLGPGRYEVWHDDRRTEAVVIDPDAWVPTPGFPDGYTHVANITTESLSDAVLATSYGGSFSWGSRPSGIDEIEVLAPSRPTVLGDVVVSPDGNPYLMSASGFAEIERSGVESPGPSPNLADLEVALSDLELGWGQARSDALRAQENPPGWEVAETRPGEAMTRNNSATDYELLLREAARRPANDNFKDLGVDR